MIKSFKKYIIYIILSVSIIGNVIFTLIFAWERIRSEPPFSPTEFTERSINVLRMAITHCAEEANYLPQSKETLIIDLLTKDKLSSDILSPREYYWHFAVLPDKGICMLDGWWHTIKYVYRQDGQKESFRLYSCGPNMIDENGKGDDIGTGEWVYIRDKENRLRLKPARN